MPEENILIVIIFALLSLVSSTEGKPTAEPRKALNTLASITSNPCQKNQNGKDLTLSFNVTERVRTPPFLKGDCLSVCLTNEKIACREKNSANTECVHESSTAALCYNSTFKIYDKNNTDGTVTMSVTGPKELIDKLSPVCFTVHVSGIHINHQCEYNGSASAGTTSTVLPFSNLTTTPSPKPHPGVATPTNLTVASSLKPHPDAGTPTNLTVTSSLKPDPDAGKLEEDRIYILVGILVPVALFVISVVVWCLYKKNIQNIQS